MFSLRLTGHLQGVSKTYATYVSTYLLRFPHVIILLLPCLQFLKLTVWLNKLNIVKINQKQILKNTIKLSTTLKTVFLKTDFAISSCAVSFGTRCLVFCLYTTRVCNKLSLNVCTHKHQSLNFKQLIDAF
jgi:hypothetical protein